MVRSQKSFQRNFNAILCLVENFGDMKNKKTCVCRGGLREGGQRGEGGGGE